jgi:tetratricopeptide (TPR) repeat protein
MKDKEIKIVVKKGNEFNSEIVIGGEKYFVQTEMRRLKSPLITTRVYLKGRIISVKETDVRDLAGKPGLEEGFHEYMVSQHQQVISILKKEKMSELNTPAHYLEELKILLRKNENTKAMELMGEALTRHPDNLYLLSYKGYLEAYVQRNFKHGITTCRKAIEKLREKMPFGEEFLLPFFYLNLGKAYLAAGRRLEAVTAFDKVMEIDPENSETMDIMKKVGARRKPVMPFLERSNPINKYMGKLLYKMKR